MRRYASLYWLFLIQRFKILMEYRVNFLIGAGSTVIMQLAGLLTIWVVMQQVPDLAGWQLAEIWLIYGLITLAKSINHMFADNLWTLGESYVRSGAFDRFLVRPIDPLFHLLADRFCHDGIGNFLVGAALVTQASFDLGLVWTPLKLVNVILTVLGGGAIFIALNLAASISAFWVMDSVPLIRIIFEIHEFAKYPLVIYPRAIGILLTWLIPFGLASYYPAQYLLDRASGPAAWAAPVVGGLFLYGAYQIWLFGLRHYASTGS